VKRVLILGGSGFIGKVFAERCRSAEYEVIIVSQLNDGKSILNISYNYDELSSLLKKYRFDLILFFSGNPYPEYSEDNPSTDIRLTNQPLVCLLEAMKDSASKGKIWFASSVAVYGRTKKQPQNESDECFPLSKYAVSKLMGEEHIKYYCRTYGLRGGSFRIFSTFGQGLRRQIVFDIYQKISKNQGTIELFGSGKEARDICYVDNQVDRMWHVIHHTSPEGDVFNIGSGKLTSVSELAESIVDIMEAKVKIEFTQQIRAFDGLAWVADISRIRKIGYEKEEVLLKGLNQTIAWFNKNGEDQ